MRARIWIPLSIAIALVAVSACMSGQVSRGPVGTPVPTKTLRPTFTHTPEKPTLTPTPAPPTETPTPEEPTATPVPPTQEPTATPEAATFTVTSATLNVRSGPGTNYGTIGQIRQGQTFTITGKNPAGNWWQFDYNGRAGWVSGTLVRVTNGQLVQVAANIPAAPTARPQPTAAPRPAAPQPPPAAPAPSFRFGLTGKNQLRTNSNAYVTVWCFVINRAGNGLSAGTLRLTRGGAAIAEKAFLGGTEFARGDAGYSSEFLYNPECKIEVPAADGTYSAYIIEGGQQISDAFNFTVSGESNRTAIIEWREK